jgi:type IV pilus assembly protein PilA
MEMIMKRALAKKNGKKGFTLVEVIVVLVILAILAAIAIPALTGYIDKANKRAVITEARTVAVALQTIASEAYGDGLAIIDAGTAKTGATTLEALYGETGSNKTDSILKAIDDLSGSNFVAKSATITNITFDGKTLDTFNFTNGGKTVIYDKDAASGPKYKVS